MTESPIFLIGGGRDAGAVRASHAPFVAARSDGGTVACLVRDEGEDTDRARWEGNLRDAGAAARVRPDGDEVAVAFFAAGPV